MAELQVPAGFGTLPLEAKPFDLGAALKTAAELRASQASTGATNAETAIRQAQLPGVQAQSQIQGNQAQMSKLTTGNQLIAAGMSQLDPTDPDFAEKADEILQGLTEQGVTNARQWIGHVHTANDLNKIVGIYGAGSPAAAAAAAQGGGSAPLPPPSPDMVQQFAQLPPDRLQAAAQKLTTWHQALVAVRNSPDPEKAFNAAVASQGFPQYSGTYKQNYDQLLSHVAEMDASAQAVLQNTGVGLPGAPPATKFENVGGVGLVGVNPYAGGGQGAAKVVVPEPGTWSYAGVNPTTGAPIMLNNKTGEQREGTAPIGAKPTNAGAGGAFNAKREAWLAVHSGDDQGALDFANGRKQLSPGEAMAAAQSRASAELNALSMAGSPPADPQAWLRAQTGANYQQIMAAAVPAAPEGGAPAGLPQRAIDTLKAAGGKPVQFNNKQVWAFRNGKPVRIR